MPTIKPKRGDLFVLNHIRIHRHYIERLEALAGDLDTSEEYAPGGKLKKNERLRLALRMGIETLERQFQKKGDGRE